MHNLFKKSLQERQQLIQVQRKAFDRVSSNIKRQFEGRIAVRRINNGRLESLHEFIATLNQRGITRWWNEREKSLQPSPAELLRLLETHRLEKVGMSEAVQKTFQAQMTPAKRRVLAALYCPDRYLLEYQPDCNSDYRPLDELSGGKRVNILLSLLLEAEDERPLVIDQPEDELDNRFLFETLLPTLGRLKGRRQVILRRPTVRQTTGRMTA